MASIFIGPFVGKVVVGDDDHATMIISHVHSPHRSIAEIDMGVPFSGITEIDVWGTMMWWLRAGDRSLINDLAGTYTTVGCRSVEEDAPDEYTEVD